MSDEKKAAAAHDTIGSAAARLGVPRSLLSKAKKAGAPGFQGSRVYLAILIPWLIKWLYETGGLAEVDRYDREMRKAKLEAFQEDRARERGDWIEWVAVQQWQQGLAEGIKAILRGKLKNELPPKLEGLRAPEIAAKMDGLIAELVGLIREPVLNRRDAETQSNGIEPQRRGDAERGKEDA